MLQSSSEDASNFRFPLHQLTNVRSIPHHLKESEFRDVQYLCAGSNSYVYTAIQNDELVVVKMLKSKLSNPRVAEQEMEIEMHLLSKIEHPNIISVKGSGRLPRQFLVVEHLDRGTLSNILDDPSIFNPDSDFKNGKRLSVKNSLSIARQLITALKYLHEDLSSNATIIHRGNYLSFLV